MTTEERQLVMEQLASSEAYLVACLQPLSAAEWSFREVPGRWSTAEIVEHLILFEGFILGTIRQTLERPPELEKKTRAAEKEPLVLGLANSRAEKINAREVVKPTGQWSSAELIARLEEARAQTLAFAASTGASLRDHFFPHLAFGDLDCFQWLQVLVQHTARHRLQIEDIQAHPDYPRLSAR